MQLPTPRRTNESKVAGVAGGLAEAGGIDPSLVRIAFAVLALAGGSGILLYIGAWLLMLPPPVEGLGFEQDIGAGHGAVGSLAQRPTVLIVLAGPVLSAAVWVLIISLNGLDWLPMTILFLLFGGTVLLNRRSDQAIAMMAPPQTPPAPTTIMPTPFTQTPPPAIPSPHIPPPPSFPSPHIPPPPSFPSPPIPPLVEEPVAEEPQAADTSVMETPVIDTSVIDTSVIDTSVMDTPVMDIVEPPGPPIDPLDDLTFDHDWPAPSAMDQLPPHEDGSRQHWAMARTAEETTLVSRQPSHPHLPLASITLAAMAFLLGATLVSGTVFNADISAVTAAGLATAAVGIAVSISAFTGRTLRLLPIAILSLIVLAVSPIIEVAVDGGIGARTITVTDVENLRPSYSVGVGSLDLRLEDLVITEDTLLRANVGIGELQITVPPDVAVELRGTTKAGYVFLLDRERSGLDVTFTRIPGGTNDTGPRLIIEAENTIGSIDVYRGR